MDGSWLDNKWAVGLVGLVIAITCLAVIAFVLMGYLPNTIGQ